MVDTWDNNHKLLMQKINFWVFSILLKLIPCVLLTLLSGKLIKFLCDAKERKKRLIGGNFNHHRSGTASAGPTSSSETGHRKSAHTQQQRRESAALTGNQPRNGGPNRSVRPALHVPQATEVYLEIADGSPTECDRSSRSSRGGSDTTANGPWQRFSR